MYCIFHLPRTGSHYLHNLINSSLIYLDPRHRGTQIEPFNPRFNTPQQIQDKYNAFVNNDPPVTVKMSINHYPWLAEAFVNHPKYTTIFIKPQNYRERLLKALVEKRLDTHSDGTDRRSSRIPMKGKLRFSDELIRERFEHYKIHMDYEHRCNYVFYDEFIFIHSEEVLSTLNLPLVTSRYKRIAPFHSDSEMLENVGEFNEQYDKLSVDMFGYVV